MYHLHRVHGSPQIGPPSEEHEGRRHKATSDKQHGAASEGSLAQAATADPCKQWIDVHPNLRWSEHFEELAERNWETCDTESVNARYHAQTGSKLNRFRTDACTVHHYDEVRVRWSKPPKLAAKTAPSQISRASDDSKPRENAAGYLAQAGDS